MIILLMSVLLIVCYILYKQWLKGYDKYTHNLPGARSTTVLGDLIRFYLIHDKDSTGLVRLLVKMSTKYHKHGIMQFWMGPVLSVVIWSPEYIAEVANNPHTARKGKLFSWILGGLAEGVFTNEGNKEWKELRRPLIQSMKRQTLHTKFHDVFVERVKDFIQYLKENKPDNTMNIIDETSLLHCDIVSELFFGVPVTDLREKKFHTVEIGNKFLDGIIQSLLKLWPFMFRRFSTQYQDVVKKGFHFIQLIINERKRCMANDIDSSNVDYYSDFLIRRAAEKNFDDYKICCHMAEIIMAGSESTSVTTSTLIVFLAMHSDLQEEIYQEQVDIFQDDITKDPSPEDLNKMDLLNRAIKETFRHIATPLIHKQATAEIQIGEKYKIPKDTYVFVSNRVVHYDPKYWERPEEFFPDHFLPEQVAARPTYAYIPFGIGPRSCPGMRYGHQHVAVELSLLLRHFKFSTKNQYKDIVYGMSLLCKLQHEFYQVTFQERHVNNAS